MEFFNWIVKILLFITCISISHSMALTEKYDILEVIQDNIPVDSLEIANGTDGFIAIKLLDDVPVNIALDKFAEPLDTLRPPFEIYALITLEIRNSPCLFSISVDSTKKVALCFEQFHRNKARVKLLDTEIFSDISFVYSDFKNDDWSKIILRVEETKVELYIDCKLRESRDVDVIKEINFSKESRLFLGKFNDLDEEMFEGSIQNLQIFPNPDFYGRNDVCNDELTLPDSIEPNSSTVKVDTSSPQNLEVRKFIFL
nr:uncharacterized protein LOC117988543 [Maniola hyperantus]